MVIVYPIELISRGYRSHQFKLQKEHKSRMDARLSSQTLFWLNCISLHKVVLFSKIFFNELGAATFLFFLLLSGKCQWPPCGNQSGQRNKIIARNRGPRGNAQGKNNLNLNMSHLRSSTHHTALTTRN